MSQSQTPARGYKCLVPSEEEVDISGLKCCRCLHKRTEKKKRLATSDCLT